MKMVRLLQISLYFKEFDGVKGRGGRPLTIERDRNAVNLRVTSLTYNRRNGTAV